MWQVPLAVSILAAAFSQIVQRTVLSKDNDPIAYSIVVQLIAGLIFLSLSLIFGIQPLKIELSSVLPNIALMVLLYVGLNILSFTAIKQIEISEFTILFSTRSFWSILVAIFFLGETFSLSQSLGSILLFCSVIIVCWKKKQLSFSRGEILALLSAICVGGGFVNDAYLTRYFDIYFYNFLAFILPATAMWLFYPKKTKQMKDLFKDKKTALFVLFTSFLFVISQSTILIAYKLGNNAAIIGSLIQLITIVTVWLAFVFLKERKDIFKKITAAMISIMGAILVK